MTQWGMLLLATYIGLGLSGLDMKRTLRYVIALTVVVVTLAGVSMGAQ